MSLLVKVDELPPSLVDLLPHLWELALVGVQRDEHLVGQLVAQVGPEHLLVLRLHVEQVVANPVALVNLRQRLRQVLARRLAR